MGKYISLGEYNKFYKYFWYFLITKLIYRYFLESFFIDKVDLLKNIFPNNVLIQGGFNYFGLSIFSIFLYKYEVKQKKVESEKPIHYNNSENSHMNVELIYNDLVDTKYFTLPDLMLIVLLYFCNQFFFHFSLFQLKGLDYWMFEILFIALVFSKLYNLPIYKHRKFAIFFTIIFCTFFKILSTIWRFIDDDNKKIYTKYEWIVPLGIIFFISFTYLRAYIFVKIKFLFDKKFILPSNILFLYSFFGAFVSFIVSIIPSNIPCTDASYNLNLTSFKDDLIKTVCQVKESNSNILYYENYSIYFKVLFEINILALFLFILKVVLYFFNKLFYLYIIKDLGAEYIICVNSIYYIITEIIDLCYFLFKENNNGFKFYKFYGMIAQIFSFLGTLIYLELIELHFFELDHNLKINIEKRALEDKDLEFGFELTDEEDKNRDSEGNINITTY